MRTFKATAAGRCDACPKEYQRGRMIGEIQQGRAIVRGHVTCMLNVADRETSAQRLARYQSKPHAWL